MNATCDNLASDWSAWWLPSPSQRPSVGNVKDLMRVQKFPEAVEKLSALQAAALRVDEHQQRTDVFVQRVVLRDDDSRQQTQTAASPRTDVSSSPDFYLDLGDDEGGERLVVDGCVFSQHVDPLSFRETRHLQDHRT